MLAVILSRRYRHCSLVLTGFSDVVLVKPVITFWSLKNERCYVFGKKHLDA